jgi:hypothetical protein
MAFFVGGQLMLAAVVVPVLRGLDDRGPLVAVLLALTCVGPNGMRSTRRSSSCRWRSFGSESRSRVERRFDRAQTFVHVYEV